MLDLFIKNTALVGINTICGDIDKNKDKILRAISEAKSLNKTNIFFPQMTISGLNIKDLFFIKSFVTLCTKAFLDIQKKLDANITVGLGLPLLDTNGIIHEGYIVFNKDRIISLDILDTDIQNKIQKAYKFSKINDNDEFLYDICSYNDKDNLVFVGFENFNYKDKSHSLDVGAKSLTYKVFGSLSFTHDVTDFTINPIAQVTSYDSVHIYNAILALIDTSLVLNINLLGNENGANIYEGQCFFYKDGKVLAYNLPLSFKDFVICSSECHIEDNLNEYESVFKTIALGLFDYMSKTYSKGYVVSLSGGADSSVCASAVIAAHAYALSELGDEYFKKMASLGLHFNKDLFDGNVEKYIKNIVAKEVLTVVYQATKNSSQKTFKMFKDLAICLGAKAYNWDVTQSIESYVDTVKSVNKDYKLTFEDNDLAMQNIQARSRLPGLWLLTNIENKLLIATSNRSEGVVGYCTLDGDTAGSISPIGTIPKSYLLKLIEYIATKGLHLANGQTFLIKDLYPLCVTAPTAELRPGFNQKDESDLMPYPLLDLLTKLFYEKHLSPSQMLLHVNNDTYAKSLNRDLKADIKRFLTLCFRAQWKRERLAPAFSACKANNFALPVLNGALKAFLDDLEKA